MKKILIGLLLSCVALINTRCITAEKHLQKALKKDPNIVLCDSVDTVYKSIPASGGVVESSDSIIINTKKIYIKAIAKGDIILEWLLKEDSIMTIENTPIIKPKLSNRQTRSNNKKEVKLEKEKTKQIQSDNKVLIKEIKTNAKEKNKNSLFWYLFTFALGFITCMFIKK